MTRRRQAVRWATAAALAATLAIVACKSSEPPSAKSALAPTSLALAKTPLEPAVALAGAGAGAGAGSGAGLSSAVAYAAVSGFRDRMCDCAGRKDTACAQVVIREMAEWASGLAKLPDTVVPTAAEQHLMDEASADMTRCMTTAITGTSASAAPSAMLAEDPDGISAMADVANMPPACARYMRVVYRFADCAKIPDAAKAALRSSAHQVTENFRELAGLPAEAVRSAGEGCATAEAAIRRNAKQVGCSLDPTGP